MNFLVVVYAVGLLTFGALNTLVTKLTFQMKAEDLSGHMEVFQKPWFGVYRMFQGMSIVMLLHVVLELKNRRRRRLPVDLQESLTASVAPPVTPLKSYFVVIVPAALDLLGTFFTYVGLFYVAPSVWQMFRGAMVIFVTIFSVVVLKRKLSQCRIFGIFLVIVAMTLVGLANAESSGTPSTVAEVSSVMRLFGMAMILIGMFLQGGQVIVEELLMKDLSAPPLLVVGMEGVWGCILMLCVVFPIVGYLPGNDYGGCQESLENDLAMVRNNHQLQVVIVVYLVSVLLFNIAGMMVTYQLSAIHRTFLEAMRTAVVWVADLGIHAVYPLSEFGETWSIWSYLQLAGFLLMIIGQATYSEMITFGLRTSQTRAASPAASPSTLQSPTGRLNLCVDLPEEGVDDRPLGKASGNGFVMVEEAPDR